MNFLLRNDFFTYNNLFESGLKRCSYPLLRKIKATLNYNKKKKNSITNCG